LEEKQLTQPKLADLATSLQQELIENGLQKELMTVTHGESTGRI
jgi:hypothetical protein